MLTGDFIKNFEPHNYEITHMLYSNRFDYLISCSSDLKLKVHKNMEKNMMITYPQKGDTYILNPQITNSLYNIRKSLLLLVKS